jgi:hypothetical protein
MCAAKLNSPPPQNAYDPDAKNPSKSPDHVTLARRAANGDTASRIIINDLVHPIITYQTNRFCNRFCHANRYRYVCSLQSRRASRAPRDALLCEYGNASYAWMLEDLTNPGRLLRFEGRQGARLNDYLYRIANSLPFYERWKDWRLGRKAHIPTYIQALHPAAGRVFYYLRAQWSIAEIAHALQMGEEEVENLCQDIVAGLAERRRLYLLDPPRTVSLAEPEHRPDEPGKSQGREKEIHYHDEALEQREAKQKLNRAWGKLSTVEQYILEAMLIDEQEAGDVLVALQKLDISIKKGVAPADTNRQQLYYFRRKTLSKLTGLMGRQ